MNLAKASILGASGLVVVGGAGLFTANELTKETFLDSFGGKKNVTSTEDSEKGSTAWKLLTKKFKYSSDSDSSNHDPEFFRLKNEKDEPLRKEKLMKLCKETASKFSKSFLNKGDPKLFNSYQTFCISDFWNIFTEMGFHAIDGRDIENYEATHIKTALSNLKNHSDNETNGKVREEPLLQALKEKITTGSYDSVENQKALMEWCKSKRMGYYSNQEDNTWKLADRYCLNPNKKNIQLVKSDN